MNEQIEGGDAATVQVALQHIYLGCIDEQQQKDTQLLARLISLAANLQIESLKGACKLLLCKQLADNETSQVG